MTCTNSEMVVCTVLSPNHSGPRTHAIDRITPHCAVELVSAEALGEIFTHPEKEASCHYGIGTKGRVVLSVA